MIQKHISILAIWALAQLTLTPALAGEIILYPNQHCSHGFNNFDIFASSESTGCTKAQLSENEPQIYAASTSRNIGPSCKFNLYTDSLCERLAHSLTSSGPKQTCVNIKQGLRSYKISCGKPNQKPLSRPKSIDSFTAAGGFYYFQPRVTYRGKPSGHNTAYAYLPFIDGDKKYKPAGTPAEAGLALAASLFKNVPNGGYSYRASATVDGTTYHVDLQGDKGNKYTAEKVAAAFGQAAFASMMADSVQALQIRPTSYLFYSLGLGGIQIGGANITYIG